MYDCIMITVIHNLLLCCPGYQFISHNIRFLHTSKNAIYSKIIIFYPCFPYLCISTSYALRMQGETRECHNFTEKNMRSDSILKVINIWAAFRMQGESELRVTTSPHLSLPLSSLLYLSLCLFPTTCFWSLWNTPLCPLAFHPLGSSCMAECFKSQQAAHGLWLILVTKSQPDS